MSLLDDLARAASSISDTANSIGAAAKAASQSPQTAPSNGSVASETAQKQAAATSAAWKKWLPIAAVAGGVGLLLVLLFRRKR